jgi:hypothetical protein
MDSHRCCDFIQRITAAFEYRTDRPNCMKGGPSPAILALASHERLRRRKAAASFGVIRS